MSRVKNIFLATFISPEIVALLVVIAILYLEPIWLETIGLKIRSDAEVWKYLPTLTLAFSAMAFRYSSKLRAPLENASNKALYEWSLYHLLVERVMVSLFFSISCGITGLSLWILGGSMAPSSLGAAFLAATLISAITALTMLLAHQKLRELIDRYTN